MAEAAVNFAIGTLGSLLVEEIKLLGSAKQEVESIKKELESIRSFLKDADARAAAEEEGESNEGVLTWVKQVREEAYHIEDVLDEYILNEAKHPHGDRRGLTRLLRKLCCFIIELKLCHGISSEIEDIKSSLADIQRRGQRYKFKSIEQGSSSGTRNVIPHDSRVDSFFIEDAEVVGIETTRDQLIDLLVNGKINRSVITVVGEGGLGKTTLAGKIYNNETTKKHFDCQALITVGKEYMKKDLLRSIIHQLCDRTESLPVGIDKMEEKDLIPTLRENLKNKCYMVVFDDVCKVEFWGDVEHALPDNNKSSRIMITSRNKGVTDFVPISIRHVHMLQPLLYDKAWQLFCRKAFGSEESCPPVLEKLSHDIIAKCGGLPLAIVAVGGLLSNKNKVVSEWKNLLEGLGSKLGSDPHLKSCNRVLSEGYYDLPHHLKSCLLYFGLFPESYGIKCGRLIRLWIAEGFVPKNKRTPPEKIAEEYLTQLIDRNLVQVSERKVSGRVRRCRVHDLMYEIIIRKTEELGFCGVLKGEDSSCCSKSRRISIQKSTDSILESIKDSKARSIYLFNIDKLPESFVVSFVADFKLIKVLDFEDAPMDCLPDEVGNLFHLHYLSLKHTKVKELPKSIGMLVNLETVDLKWSLVSELPIEINNLKKLRCLLLRRLVFHHPYGSFAEIKEGFGALSDLQQLRYVHANSEVIIELRKLRQLRKLTISLANSDVKDLFAIVENMHNLEQLAVMPRSGKEILDMQSVVSPPQSLERFYLEGNIKKLPVWISELQNLIRMQLVLEGPMEDPIRVVQALPNLLKLLLEMTYCDEQLHFKEGWFPKLKELSLRNYKGLKSMIIDKGAMPNLKELKIGPCPLLKEIPTGIEHLRKLEILRFFKMLKEIYPMTQTENWKQATKHIPEVDVTYKGTNRKYKFYTTKYLSSLTPEDLERLIKKIDPSEEQSHP